MRENSGVALAVAGTMTAFLTIVAWLLVPLVWLSLTIYALVKWIGSAPDAANPAAVLLVVVGLVTALTLVMAGLVALIGRSMTPKRRRRTDAIEAVGL
jgi:hypothetical protein